MMSYYIIILLYCLSFRSQQQTSPAGASLRGCRARDFGDIELLSEAGDVHSRAQRVLGQTRLSTGDPSH